MSGPNRTMEVRELFRQSVKQQSVHEGTSVAQTMPEIAFMMSVLGSFLRLNTIHRTYSYYVPLKGRSAIMVMFSCFVSQWVKLHATLNMVVRLCAY